MTEGAEFSLLAGNAVEAGLAWVAPPTVRRESVEVERRQGREGRAVSALVWGSGPPELVLLHGGGQNAHTWDTVALAIDRPLVALDLPGHGHSGWRDDHCYTPAAMAADVAVALSQLAPDAALVVGMSLGGLTALCLAVDHPELVARLALVDITPGTDVAKAEPILAFLSGPERFASFDEMLERTVAFNPTRSVSSLRRGVIHNAREHADGSWGWRWDPSARWRTSSTGPGAGPVDRAGRGKGAEITTGSGSGVRGFEVLWPVVDAVGVPLLLIRGGRSSVVSDDDAAELLRRRPDACIEVVSDAGHSIQGDQPVELARRLARFLDG